VKVRLTPHPSLRAPDGFTLAHVSVGPDQEACCVWASAAAGTPGYGHGGDRGVVTQQDDAGAVWQSCVLSEPLPQFPLAQPHPLGWVVIGMRCRRGEQNAWLFDTSGQCRGSGRVGDGVEEAYTTHDGDLWVSYFDEGVFGDDDIAASGCVRWQVSGDEHGWCSFDPAWQLDYAEMADCYAMNVTDKTTYACPYTGFPVIVIKEGSTTVLPSRIEGPAALVTDGYRMAIIGSYRKRDAVAVGILERDRFKLVKTVNLAIDERDWTKIQFAGRGDRLHAFGADGRWWSTTLDELCETR